MGGDEEIIGRSGAGATASIVANFRGGGRRGEKEGGGDHHHDDDDVNDEATPLSNP